MVMTDRKSMEDLREEISQTPTEGCPDCEQAGVCCTNCWSNWLHALSVSGQKEEGKHGN